jgi:hypothetical protein
LVRVGDNGMEGQNLRTVNAPCQVYSEYSKWPHPAVLTEVGLPYFFILFKGTMSRDLLLQVFFHESSLGSLRIFSKIRGNIRANIASPVSRTPVANLPTVPTTPAANLPLVLIRRWQIKTISNCLHLKVKLEGKHVSMC